MKNWKIIGLIAVMSVIFFGCQSGKEEQNYSASDLDSFKSELDSIIQNTNEAALLQQKIDALLLNEDERVVLLGMEYLYKVSDDYERLDSIGQAQAARFPDGIQARLKAYQEIFGEESTELKEKKFYEWKAQYPAEQFDIENRDIYNMMASIIASEYDQAGKSADAQRMIGQLTDNPNLPYYWHQLASANLEKGDTALAKNYLHKVIKDCERWAKVDELRPQTIDNINNMHAGAYRYMGAILVEQDSCEKALKFFLMFKERTGYLDFDVNKWSADCLSKSGNVDSAFYLLEQIVETNEGSNEDFALWKKYYLMAGHSEAEFASYKKEFDERLIAEMKQRIVDEAINEPAPDLHFYNMNGEKVLLSSLRGKLVVLDFWATWCHPCIASFPMMREVRDLYKDDDDIVFLFINTMEMGDFETAKNKVNEFLASENYDFTVYLDKDPQTNESAAAKAMHVDAIPVKYIIDKQGSIRLKILGFVENEEFERAQLTTIIDYFKD